MGRFARLIRRYLDIKHKHAIYFYATIVGLLSGIAAITVAYLLDLSIEQVHHFLGKEEHRSESILERLSGLNDNYLISISIVLLPALGGLCSGLIIRSFSKESSGGGVDKVIHSFHYKEGRMSSKVPIWKSLATIFTVGSGGSGGKEGPIAHIGASIGVSVSYLIDAGARARRTLMLSGIAAGLGSVFKAPLGGALTAVEMVYKEDIESDALIPCFISSVTAYIVYTSYAGNKPIIDGGDLHFFQASELLFYFLLGILCFLFGYLFIKGFNDARHLMKRLKVPGFIKPAIGGLIVGIISLFFFEVAGEGVNFLELTLNGKTLNFFEFGIIGTILSFLLLAFLKILATTFTLGSGGSAGIFGPSMFIGGMLGAAVGNFAQLMLPEHDIQIAAFILVGMGAFYSGVANAPMAGIIMICELSGSYVLLPPLIVVSIFAFILSKKVSFYTNQVENRFKSPAHYWDMKFDVIDNMLIRDKFEKFNDLAVIKNDMPFSRLLAHSREIQASDYVVVNPDDSYLGIVSLRKIDLSVNTGAVHEYADQSIPSVNYFASLGKALTIMRDYDVDKVAVIKDKKVIGYLRFRDIFICYTKTVNSWNT